MSKVQELLSSLKNQGSFRDQKKALDEVARMLKEEAKMLADKIPHIKFGKKKVALPDKGGVSFYGLQKFPITLYPEQVYELKQIINSPEFDKWMKENKGSFSTKEKAMEEKQQVTA